MREMAFEQRFLNGFIVLTVFQLCSSSDTISPLRCIKDGEILVSIEENFALGFFSPINSTNRYVGIWYNKVPQQTVVWVTNRDFPVPDSTGVLAINEDGNLVVLQGDQKSPLWSTNVSTETNNSTAKLLDSGNLVLSNGPSNRVIWQSFDYPTDTWLPGMKLGINQKTGLNWTITSWKSSNNPARGDYSLGLDPRGSPQFFFYKGSAPYYRSGPWNGREFSGLPAMHHTHLIRLNFISDGNEIYLTYSLDDSSIFVRTMVDQSGLVRPMTWLDRIRGWNVFLSAPTDICDYYGHCGVYGICNHDQVVECKCLQGFEPKSPRDWFLRDWSGGCLRKRALDCGVGEGFLKLAHVKVPDTSISRVEVLNSSLKDCEKECLRDCSCTGYTSADIRGEESGCIAWYGDLIDVREFTDGGQEFYLRVDAVELAQATRESKGFLGKEHVVVILTVSLEVGVLLLFGCGYYLLKKRKKKGKIERRRHRVLPNLTTSSVTFKDSTCANELDDSRTHLELPFFELNALIAATDNFSSSNMLGQGGFGSVYKPSSLPSIGQLSNGREIAVKRLSKNSGQGIEEFRNEIMLISKLQHRNLVRLMGYCIQEEEKMLIYEYMPNKSLDTFIFDLGRRALIDWRKRFEIIVGIAQGILYLHHGSRFRVIHRDLKASNILLDADLNPKISDFGMARMFEGNQTQANTRRVVGTYGYMSPEYAMKGLFSEKSDVFSFGVLLLEIISGKKNTSYNHDDPFLNLIEHAWNLWREDKVWEIVDSSIGNLCHTHEVLRCVQVGLLCVQERAINRPTMSSVIFMLINETTLPQPNRPAFVTREILKDMHPSSIIEETITVVKGR